MLAPPARKALGPSASAIGLLISGGEQKLAQCVRPDVLRRLSPRSYAQGANRNGQPKEYQRFSVPNGAAEQPRHATKDQSIFRP